MELRESWNKLRAEKPKLRVRDAAEVLGVSEAELVATGCAEGTVRLRDDWGAVLLRVPALGPVMALTRNAHCVHERRGTYQGVRVGTSGALVVGPDIDLRIDFSAWKRGFAVREGEKRSLQFFDGAGVAVHKIHLEDGSNAEAFDAIARDLASPDQRAVEVVEPPAAPVAARPDEVIDVVRMREAWHFLADTHEFQALLDRFEVGRLQALRLAGEELAVRVHTSSARRVLEEAAARSLPIMVFVGSAGCLQIHTGPVENIKILGPWLNVLDRSFNLHLREDAIASAWVVRKPTRDGVVTSVELFDAAGELIAMMFGKRKPGAPELAGWRHLATELTLEARA